jgi:hypothetical protein
MKIVVDVPDAIVAPVKVRLDSEPTEVLETVALDAIIKYLHALALARIVPE